MSPTLPFRRAPRGALSTAPAVPSMGGMPRSLTSPSVAIIMGSDSDWPTMKAAAESLDRFGIDYEVEVVSAHRTPEKMVRFGQEAAGRGIRVIIAGAGGAAHLPGMVASVTTLPVIGVPGVTVVAEARSSSLKP